MKNTGGSVAAGYAVRTLDLSNVVFAVWALWALYAGAPALRVGASRIHGAHLGLAIILLGIGLVLRRILDRARRYPHMLGFLWRALSGDPGKAPDEEPEEGRSESFRARWPLWAGVAGTSMSIMLTELLITRVFSVTLRYHFAFMAISLALLGLGTGGIVVYLFAPRFPAARLSPQVAWISVFAGLATVAAVFTLLGTEVKLAYSPANFVNLLRMYLAAFVPFFFSGLIIALLFTHRSRHIGRLYFFDLIAAAAAGPLMIPLTGLMGAPGGLVVAAAAVLLSGAAIAHMGGYRRGKIFCLALAGLLLVGAVVDASQGVLTIRFAKGKTQRKVIFSKWNSFSRVAVYGLNHEAWGLSPAYRGPVRPSLWLDIDASASTPIINLEGMRPEDVEHLRWVLTAYGYALRPGGEALVIGAGGGRDVIAALSHGFKRVVGVEINPIIVNDVMLGRFARYTGRLYENPRVRVYVDDGRSFVHRSKRRFDVVHLSLVDTWATTSAGAYILSENNLYTVEAVTDYLLHLKNDGLLSIARWSRGALRTISLLYEAGRRLNMAPLSRRIAVLGHANLVQLLVRKTPFTVEEIRDVGVRARRQRFRVYYLPGADGPSMFRDNVYARMIRAPDRFIASAVNDYSPVTDDRPFFFNFTRLRDVYRKIKQSRFLFGDGLSNLISVLAITVCMVLFFFLATMAVFLMRRVARGKVERRKEPASFPSRGLRMLPYFCLLGFGFIVVEIVLIQKLLLLLGHPTTSLVVSLSGILTGSGLGALAVSRLPRERTVRYGRVALAFIVLSVILLRLGLQPLATSVVSASLVPRIVVAFLLVMGVGFLMGMPLPLGVRILDRHPEDHELVPWAWGLNGGLSVVGSGTAIFLAMFFGFNTTLLVGGAAYVLALLVIATLSDRRSEGRSEGETQPDGHHSSPSP